MATATRPPGYQLPTRPDQNAGRKVEGFVTPTQDKQPQVMSIPPKRVLPIIFLPGIMGTNLRMKKARQDELRKKNNVAWRPEDLWESKKLANGDASLRQSQLDPSQTEVDVYDPKTNPTGDAKETSDQRHHNVKSDLHYGLDVSVDTPLLMDDPITKKGRRTKEEKARARGWGEVYFDSYRKVLEMCELQLNTVFDLGRLAPWWKRIVGVPPAQWQASPEPPLQPLTEDMLMQAVKGCWFPVHAVGYNWLQSNKDSGIYVAERVAKVMREYRSQGFQCEKVIIVTHSMGGLVARALIHPEMGQMHDQVLGVVHGVMPATGAGAAYKRMRCGFEDPGILSMSPIASVTAKILGNLGSEVTAVLANAQGGLELLPSQAYGNEWLKVMHGELTLKSLPKNGDPYEEIYKLPNKWYGLLRQEWINPANILRTSGFSKTCILLDQAKNFHNAIAHTYHEQSYAHYGAGRVHAAWHHVVWDIEAYPMAQKNSSAHVANVDALAFAPDNNPLGVNPDNKQGRLALQAAGSGTRGGNSVTEMFVAALMRAAADAGDQTVPLHSAEDQMLSRKFQGIFRQTGYEHQDSYQNENALYSTLYSVVRIAQTMVWST